MPLLQLLELITCKAQSIEPMNGLSLPACRHVMRAVHNHKREQSKAPSTRPNSMHARVRAWSGREELVGHEANPFTSRTRASYSRLCIHAQWHISYLEIHSQCIWSVWPCIHGLFESKLSKFLGKLIPIFWGVFVSHWSKPNDPHCLLYQRDSHRPPSI